MAESVNINVRIVRLAPMWVATTYGFGEHPEEIAWEKMRQFVKSAGLATDGETHRYFGFNNPSPVPGSPNYGYEQWVSIGEGAQATGETKVRAFEGGMYAVTHCTLANIGQTWEELVHWSEKSPYRYGSHQWLEEALFPPIDHDIDEQKEEFDLYLPVVE